MTAHRVALACLLACAVAAGWSFAGAADRAVWAFELSLGAVEVGVLAALYRRFRFSGLIYVLVAVHFAILAVGAKYTYSEAPPGEWLRQAFHLARNPYDRVGHFAQGFFPALLVREVLLRRTPLRPGFLTSFLTVAVCLAFSAAYELLEWGIVLAFYPDSGPEWLGMQGDPWDAQGDMLMALTGALAGLATLARVHDRSLAALARGVAARN